MATPEDALHWASVYEELLGFLNKHLAEDPKPAVVALAQRLEVRLDFWRRAAMDGEATGAR